MAAPAAPVRPRSAAAGTRRAVEPGTQPVRLCDVLARARADRDRAPAGKPVRAVRAGADDAELPAVALLGHSGGIDRDGCALSRRGADTLIVRKLRGVPPDQPRSQ